MSWLQLIDFDGTINTARFIPLKTSQSPNTTHLKSHKYNVIAGNKNSFMQSSHVIDEQTQTFVVAPKSQNTKNHNFGKILD